MSITKLPGTPNWTKPSTNSDYLSELSEEYAVKHGGSATN